MTIDMLPKDLQLQIVQFLDDTRCFVCMWLSCRSLAVVCEEFGAPVERLEWIENEGETTVRVVATGNQRKRKSFKWDRRTERSAEAAGSDSFFARSLRNVLSHLAIGARAKSQSLKEFHRLATTYRSKTITIKMRNRQTSRKTKEYLEVFGEFRRGCQTLNIECCDVKQITCFVNTFRACSFDIFGKDSASKSKFPRMDNLINCRGSVSLNGIRNIAYIDELQCQKMTIQAPQTKKCIPSLDLKTVEQWIEAWKCGGSPKKHWELHNVSVTRAKIEQLLERFHDDVTVIKLRNGLPSVWMIKVPKERNERLNVYVTMKGRVTFIVLSV